MANALYGKGKEKILSGAIDLTTATIKAALLSSAYTPNLSTDEFWSTILANLLNSQQTLASKTVTLGVFDAADITFTAVTAGSTVKAVVLYKDTGVNSTSPLIAYIDTITGFPLATNGGDISIVWDSGANKIFAL
jgi:Cu2+-containing amine oxidase